MDDKYLTTDDVRNIAEKPFNVIKFGDLNKYKDIDQLFDDNNLGIQYYPVNDILILYEAKHNSGHWCVLKRLRNFRDGEYVDSYHFLDPYGKIIDSQRNHIPKDFRKATGQDTPLILKKLYNKLENGDKFEIHYNDVGLQGDNSSTCGRYAGLFIRYDSSVEQFASQLKKLAKKMKISVDDLVIKLTAKLLVKSD